MQSGPSGDHSPNSCCAVIAAGRSQQASIC